MWYNEKCQGGEKLKKKKKKEKQNRNALFGYMTKLLNRLLNKPTNKQTKYIPMYNDALAG